MNLLAALVRVTMNAVFVVLILATTAQRFDATQLMAACAIVGALLSVEVVVALAVSVARKRCPSSRVSGWARTSTAAALSLAALGGGLLAVRTFETAAPAVETTWTSGGRTMIARQRRLPGQSVEQFIEEHLAAIAAAESEKSHVQPKHDTD